MLLEPIAADVPPKPKPFAPHNARTELPPVHTKPSSATTQEAALAAKPSSFEEERLECKICLDAPRSVRFSECGHSCVCVDCDAVLRALPPDRRRCPLCNELVTKPSEPVEDPTRTFRAPKEAKVVCPAEAGKRGVPRRALEDLGLAYAERVLSRGATTHAAPALLLVPGGGFDGVGVWSTLQYPSLETYCKRAIQRGWGIVCAPSMTGSAKQDAEVLQGAYTVAARSGDGRVVVAAHSLGGAAMVQRCRRAHKRRAPLPTALALLDSTHKGALPPVATVHWCASGKPLDDPAPRPWMRGNCSHVRSAGTRDHKAVPGVCVDSVFKYLDACVTHAMPVPPPPAPPAGRATRPVRPVRRPAPPGSPVRVVRSRPLYRIQPTSPPPVRRFARMIRLRAAAKQAPPPSDDSAFLTWADERAPRPPPYAPARPKRRPSCAARRRWRVAHLRF